MRKTSKFFYSETNNSSTIFLPFIINVFFFFKFHVLSFVANFFFLFFGFVFFVCFLICHCCSYFCICFVFFSLFCFCLFSLKYEKYEKKKNSERMCLLPYSYLSFPDKEKRWSEIGIVISLRSKCEHRWPKLTKWC